MSGVQQTETSVRQIHASISEFCSNSRKYHDRTDCHNLRQFPLVNHLVTFELSG